MLRMPDWLARVGCRRSIPHALAIKKEVRLTSSLINGLLAKANKPLGYLHSDRLDGLEHTYDAFPKATPLLYARPVFGISLVIHKSITFFPHRFHSEYTFSAQLNLTLHYTPLVHLSQFSSFSPLPPELRRCTHSTSNKTFNK